MALSRDMYANFLASDARLKGLVPQGQSQAIQQASVPQVQNLTVENTPGYNDYTTGIENSVNQTDVGRNYQTSLAELEAFKKANSNSGLYSGFWADPQLKNQYDQIYGRYQAATSPYFNALQQARTNNPFQGTMSKEQANQQSAQAFSAAVQAANPQLDFSKRNLNSLTMDRDIYQQAEDYYRRYGTGMPQVPRGSVGVDPVTGQIRFGNPVSAPIAPQRIGDGATEQQENPNSAAAQLAALSSANTSPTGSMLGGLPVPPAIQSTLQNTPPTLPNFAQQAAAIPLTPSPTALAGRGSMTNTRQAFTAPRTAAPAQVPTLGGLGQMPNLSQMLGAPSQAPMTGSAFNQAGGAFPSTPGNYGGGASGGMALEGRYGIASGNSTPFPIQGNVSVVKLTQGGDVSKARQMLQNLQSPVQHFANGSEVVPPGYRRSLFTNELVPIAATVEQLTDIYRGGDAQKTNAAAALAAVQAAAPVNTPAVNTPAVNTPAVDTPAAPISEGLQYATGEGGIGTDQYYTNIRNFIDEEAADLSADEVRAEMNKYGVSDKDVRDALAETQYSAGAVHALLNKDIGAADAPGRGVGGFEGMSANIRDYIQDQVAAKVTRDQLGNVLTQQLGEYNPETGMGGFNEQDLIRATGKTASQLLNDLYGVNKKPSTVVGGQGNDLIFAPPPDLPPLTEIFVPPTAPPPSAPPPPLTPGAEGLDPGTAIVGKIPESERVKLPQLDTAFRASAPRTAVYDRFGRISGYNYTPAAKLTPATGTNVFNFVPPGITSRPRSLLNLADVPGVTVDPVTGQLRMPLSASQRFARDRAELDQQFRRLYAGAAAKDTGLPAQAPAGAAAAFRQFAMSDPTMSAQLRMRDIEQTPLQQQDYAVGGGDGPNTQAARQLRSQFGQAPYGAALAEAFDPFLARNRAALLATAEEQKGYFDRYPDLKAEYEKNWAKTMTPDEYALYHYRTLGQKEGRTAPNLMGSPYTRQFFSEGGEASTEDFVKKQSGGDVSRGTSSPNQVSLAANPLDYAPGFSEKGLGAGFADPGVVEMIDRFDRNQIKATPELVSLDQSIAAQGSDLVNQGLARLMSVDQVTGDIDPVQSLRNLQAYDPASFESTLSTLQEVPSLVSQSGLGSLRLGMEQMQGLEGVTQAQVGDTANALATILKQPEIGGQVQDIAQNIRSITENQEPAQSVQDDEDLGGGYTSLTPIVRSSFFDKGQQEYRSGGLVRMQNGGEATVEEFIKKNVSRGTSEVPQLDAEGRLIDENAEMRSESQRMLNRLKTAQRENFRADQPLKRGVSSLAGYGEGINDPIAQTLLAIRRNLGEVGRAAVGAKPYNETNPTESYRAVQGLMNAPTPAAIPAKIAASAGDAATALAAMGPAVGAVMKPKGGNWLAPSVERGLNYLIPRTGAANRTAKETLEEMNRTYPAEELAKMSPETRASVDRAYQWLEPNVAVQNWIEKKLTKYVKNEMATPEDPVRALAERGILHIDPEQLNSYPGAGNPLDRAVARRALGYPEEGLAKSEAAKRWETASDYMIQTDRALNLLNPKEYGQGFVDQTLASNPWLTKIDPYERIYGVDTLTYRPDYSELGFDHLIDELKNSLNPNSGLPRELQVDPKKLDRISVPQAVELVDKINKWRVENAGKLRLEETLKADLYKAYPEQNYRWVQLNRPGQFAAESDAMGHSVRGYEPPDKGGSDYYGLGGFKAIESGEAKVYSLRDEKGQPHVTIEAGPDRSFVRHAEVIDELKRTGVDLVGLDENAYLAAYEAAQQAIKDRRPLQITQIKGKGNAMPTEKYLPFVQDFVRSGNWSEIKDLQNTGLILVQREQYLPGSTKKINPGYYTLDELKQLAVDNNMPQDMLNEWMRRLNAQMRHSAFKDGGEVNVPRETSTSKQQLDKLAQVSQRKKA